MQNALLILIGTLMATSTAHANGQTTHLWITDTAIEHVQDDELSILLRSHTGPLRVGTMFPDGGYAVDHGYGEAAHWEPFQDAYRDWIRENFSDLYSEEAAPHIAFYLGLASHGMADQVFDSMYMERSRIYDADGWADGATSLDTAQDIVFAAQTTPQALPEMWIPDHFPSLFEYIGIEVDMATMLDGQDRLELAVLGVGGLSEVAATVALNEEAFPWGCSHLLDEAVPGAPPFEARVVAKYWTHLWSELHGGERRLEVIGTFPNPEATGHARSRDDVEARLSLVFSRGLFDEDVTEDHFRVTSTESEHALDLNLFYGNHSHVLNISPIEGWAENADHTLTVNDTLPASDDRQLGETYTLLFSTTPTPTAMDTGQNTEQDENKTPKETSCGCATQRRGFTAWMGLLLGLMLVRRRKATSR